MNNEPTTQGKAPKYDNFFSPANHAFYGSSQYNHLDRDRKEIRLLELRPGHRGTKLMCQLVDNVPIDNISAEYQALSYCAGDHQHTVEIIVNGIPFNVFKSLGEALESAQSTVRPTQEDPLLIWADQICINQSDHEERASQVLLMRDIYHKAKRVVISLGISPNGEGLTFLNLQLTNLNALRYRIKCQYEDEGVEIVEEAILERAINDLALEMHLQTDSPRFIQRWESMKWFLCHPYWKRCWIWQEVVVAADAIILFDLDRIAWQDLQLIIRVLLVAHQLFFDHILADNQFDMRTTLWGDDTKHKTLLMMMYESGVCYEVNNLDFLLKLQGDFRQNKFSDLKFILEKVRRCKVTDPRDRIYAFLGLVYTSYRIQPDYRPTNTLSNLFCYVAKQSILFEGSLDVLAYAHEPQRPLAEQLPSWVPDWSAGEEHASLEHKVAKFKASGTLAMDASIRDHVESEKGLVLYTKAFRIDSLAQENTLLTGDKSNFELAYDTWVAALERHIQDAQATREILETILWRGRGGTLASREAEDNDGSGRIRERNNRISTSRQMLSKGSLNGKWKFFLSPKGHFGLADARGQYSDSIFILPGASVPFVLRNIDHHYVLIGEVYVYGLMYGEIMELIKDGRVEAEDIEIW